jgi:uncharacterized protein YkwD
MADSRASLVFGRWAVVVAVFVGIAIAVVGSVHANPDRVDDGRRQRKGGKHGFRFTRIEKCFMRAINRRRARGNLRPLNWDKHIGFVARRHARNMARDRDVSHDLRLGARVTRWRALGQNSGSGRGCRQLTRAFWRSTGHRSNILGRWSFLGVGVKRVGTRRLYVQQVFEYRSNPGNVYRFP